MSLARLQASFRSWLHSGAGRPPEEFGPAAFAGLGVYRNNYRSQLISCLEQSFPMTVAWLGEDAFGEACEDHVAKVAPTSWTIDAYAKNFPETLRNLYRDDPEVSELAWLEWALAEAFVSADQDPLSPTALGDVDWDEAVFGCSSSIMIATTTTNAGAIWSALASRNEPPAAALLPQAAAMLVWRLGFHARFRTIDVIEAEALQAVMGGMSFGTLCSWLVGAQGEHEGTQTAARLLTGWLADGLITCISRRASCCGAAVVYSANPG